MCVLIVTEKSLNIAKPSSYNNLTCTSASHNFDFSKQSMCECDSEYRQPWQDYIFNICFNIQSNSKESEQPGQNNKFTLWKLKLLSISYSSFDLFAKLITVNYINNLFIFNKHLHMFVLIINLYENGNFVKINWKYCIVMCT